MLFVTSWNIFNQVNKLTTNYIVQRWLIFNCTVVFFIENLKREFFFLTTFSDCHNFSCLSKQQFYFGGISEHHNSFYLI